ncbi:hypothetical protein CRG98_031956 [Punica granatum]|uniref:Uncharacterized protein n=1 Tax=Punica granatum TaxID=22663 RepID=A0A2I0IVK1_PUNGR|nr:hypothetical protein CRG98_031956 [Punica granatum]
MTANFTVYYSRHEAMIGLRGPSTPTDTYLGHHGSWPRTRPIIAALPGLIYGGRNRLEPAGLLVTW